MSYDVILVTSEYYKSLSENGFFMSTLVGLDKHAIVIRFVVLAMKSIVSTQLSNSLSPQNLCSVSRQLHSKERLNVRESQGARQVGQLNAT